MKFFFLLILCITSLVDFSDQEYENHSVESFYYLPEVKRSIDLDHLDQDLLNAAIFYATNAQREKHKLTPFKFSTSLRNAAMLHSSLMVEKKFFDHKNPVRKYRTPRDRMLHFGLQQDQISGENIGYFFAHDYKPEREYQHTKDGFFYMKGKKRIQVHTYWSFAEYAVNQWMHSPSHRKNIMNKAYTRLGCGVILDTHMGQRELPMFKLTQNFSN